MLFFGQEYRNISFLQVSVRTPNTKRKRPKGNPIKNHFFETSQEINASKTAENTAIYQKEKSPIYSPIRVIPAVRKPPFLQLRPVIPVSPPIFLKIIPSFRFFLCPKPIDFISIKSAKHRKQIKNRSASFLKSKPISLISLF